MQDILFDIVTQDIVMTGTGPDADFALTDNPSVQNGGILLNSRVSVLNNPMYGTGINQTMGSSMTIAVYEMNRWKAMCTKDGATLARWTGSVNQQGVLELDSVEVDYL